MKLRQIRFLAPLIIVMLTNSCVLFKVGTYATNALLGESDPLLAKEALPMLIKTAEILVASDANSVGNASTAASLYVLYANAFLDGEAFFVPDEEYERAGELRARARALYLRATATLVPFIDKKSPGFFARQFEIAAPSKNAVEERVKALKPFAKKDVGIMYFTAASIFAAFSSNPLNFDEVSLGPSLPRANLSSLLSAAFMLMEGALALDPEYGGGMLHDFAFSVYGSLPMELGGDREKALKEYDSAVKASNGLSAGTFVAYAQLVCLPDNDAEGFLAALEKALAIGTEAAPSNALMNALARRKAQKLKADAALYFDLSTTQER